MANHLESGHILRSGNYTYEIEKVLGQGGFGITYLAATTLKVGNVNLRVRFAIKEHFISSDCERDASSSRVIYSNPVKERVESSRKDFIAEAKRLQNVGANHENIVKVNEIFEANNTAYYVMEYLEGESLRDYIGKNGPLSPDKMKKLMLPIANAVAVLHSNNMTHLDIKPENIMLVKGDNGEIRPVLIDFGLSKHYGKDGTPTSTINTLGCSDGYSPIEQYAGITTFSPTADIYAFGATMYYCLTGKTPIKVTELKDGELANELKGKVDYDTFEAVRKATRMSKSDRENDINKLFSKSIASGEKPVGIDDNPTVDITAAGSGGEGTRVIGKKIQSGKGKTPVWKYVVFGVVAIIVLGVGIVFYQGQRGMNNDLPLDDPFWSSGRAGNYYYVDLGLPSGALWAVTNYGAGMPWETGTYLTAEEADNIIEITDKGVWRAPTKEELEELVNYTVHYSGRLEFTNGLWFQGTGVHFGLFLPAAGYEFMDNVSLDGKEGCYWSSTIETPNYDPDTESYGFGTAWRLNFTKDEKIDIGTKDSNLKFQLRLVLADSVSQESNLPIEKK